MFSGRYLYWRLVMLNASVAPRRAAHHHGTTLNSNSCRLRESRTPRHRTLNGGLIAPHLRRALLLILILSGTTAASAQPTFTFNGPEGWKVAHAGHPVPALAIIEFVRDGDKLDGWTELLAVMQFPRPKSSTPRGIYSGLKTIQEECCPGLTEWDVLEEDKESLLYVCSTSGICQGEPQQIELARLFVLQNAAYRVSYAARAELIPESRASWTDWLSGLSIDSKKGIHRLARKGS
jgi:hypothetical protein